MYLRGGVEFENYMSGILLVHAFRCCQFHINTAVSTGSVLACPVTGTGRRSRSLNVVKGGSVKKCLFTSVMSDALLSVM